MRASKTDRRADARELESMLGDREALEGVEAWLLRQRLTIDLAPRSGGRAAGAPAESPAGWLLRLVQHARAAAAASTLPE